MWKCGRCQSGYLDPRPSSDTIHKAYERYYTHADTNAPSPAGLRGLRDRLAYGYARWRYGATTAGASPLGIPIALAMPYLRWFIDRRYRHLPKKKPGATRRLLDVGCGGGKFLVDAKNCGWEVRGIDPDPKAVEQALGRGVQVEQGGIADLEAIQGQFDVITMSHVIEHLHEPLRTLKQVRKLLAPGGVFWLETPNIQSYCHQIYGTDCLSLDPPRHLFVLSESALQDLLKKAGFGSVATRFNPQWGLEIHRMSYGISKGFLPHSKYRYSTAIRMRSYLFNIREYFAPQRREVLTLIAC
jgi:SAM-dependent methyltransferase